ncbi:MAG: type 2 lanthipeptide synthetase LanM family protein, partial [Acidobacteriota bacterium]
NGYPLDFKIPRTLDRGTHGWMEFVEAAPCAEGEQIPRFYRRLGAHLALLHLLGAIDLHFENLIACGEYPVPVDLEPLFHPVLSSDPDDAWRAGSVIGVGLLPERSFRHGEGGGIDVSGIGAEAGQRLARPGLVLRQPGTDRMMFTLGSRGLPEGNHRPRLDGEEVSIQRFADDLAAGFRQLYRFVEGHRMALLAPDGPLSAFAGVETRVIVRSTMPYVRLLFDTYHPDQMRDALERDLVLDRVWGVVRRQPELEPVVRAERRDLEMGDVPYFSTRPDSRSLWTSDGERIPDLLAETGLARARRRLGRTWGPADLERQLATIRASFQMLELTADHEATPSYRLPERAPTASPEALLAAAKRVGDRLADLAFHSADRSTWVALRSMGNHRWSLDPLGVDLFTGLPGVALFLAHLGHAAEDDAYTELAKRAWRQTEALLERHPGQPDAPGAFTGWGGLAYARQYLARLWGRKDLLDGAMATLPDLPALLRSSPHQDLLDGTAGALLALLRLHRDRPLDSVLGLAKACGDQLLSTAQPEDGGLGWPMGGDGGPILSGLSHGASGMAWALAELALVSGDDAYGDAARRAMAFERGLFSEEHRNWADLRQRTRDDPSYMVAWCHGAPGVGIARLACLSLLGGPEIRADLDAALETTLEQGFGKNHCLCHGDLGNLDVLLLAAGRLGDGALARRVERLRDRIVAGIDEGGWRFGMLVPRAETPGLMVGLAGIGHQLLRLAFPDRVPSILALDLPDKGSHSLWTT